MSDATILAASGQEGMGAKCGFFQAPLGNEPIALPWACWDYFTATIALRQAAWHAEGAQVQFPDRIWSGDDVVSAGGLGGLGTNAGPRARLKPNAWVPGSN